MDLAELIAGLSREEAWPRPPGRLEVIQTHASVVFVGEREVYKVKKPVNLGFLDFSTLELRRRACAAEDELNRRLAPSAYLGVVPVTAGPRFDGEGEPLEWAVHMRHLPEERTLHSLLAREELDAKVLGRLARRLALFFFAARGGPEVAASARFEVVARNCRENFAGAERFVGQTLSRTVLARFAEQTEQCLAAGRELIEERAGRGLARDGHGDLRLDHVYWRPEQTPPEDLVVVDCIEFNERFRHQNPVCDVAFLAMELELAGRTDLAECFTRTFLEASGDAGGAALVPLYVAYRHAVRGKVRSIEQAETEVPALARAKARATARAHFLAGLARLAPAGERPTLLLVGGLPGTGKSTLARGLAATAGFVRVSSDETRKRLAGLAPTDDARAAFGKGRYTPEWNDRTYDECRRRAAAALFAGERVVVDASFREEARRRAFLELAREHGLPGLFLECRLDEREVARRLALRTHDASDADLAVHREARERWEARSLATAARSRVVSTEGTPEDVLGRTLALLRDAGLAASAAPAGRD